MNLPSRFAFVLPFLLLLVPVLPAQKLTAAPANAAVPVSLQDRRQALNSVVHDYWEEFLKYNPEFASTLGDQRYNDQVSDYSVSAVNNWLAQEQAFLMRLVAIDPTGFTGQETRVQEQLERRLEDDQNAADSKPWEMPVTPAGGIYSTFPELASTLSFTTEKDYDDWIARLHALPGAFDQVTADMDIGMEDGRVPPRPLLEKALAQVTALAHQKPGDSPLAAPLKKFPASISAAEQQEIQSEMLDTIAREVLPAYLRFQRFLQVTYIPAAPPAGADPQGTRNFRILIAVMDLRSQAQKAQGPKFDLRAFHDQVLAAGFLPVEALEQRAGAWIAAPGNGRKGASAHTSPK